MNAAGDDPDVDRGTQWKSGMSVSSSVESLRDNRKDIMMAETCIDHSIPK